MPEKRRPQRPILEDVARVAGVSPALASLALRGRPGPSQASRDAVLEAARGLGYRANATASLLARSRPRLIGVAFELTQQFHAEAIDHIYDEAERTDYEVVLGAVTRSHSLIRAVESLASGSCEGLILIGTSTLPTTLFDVVGRLPVLVLGHAEWDPRFDVVRSAGNLGVREAVSKLTALGHRNIAYIDGADASGAEDRRAGYREAMAEYGLSTQARIVPGGDAESDGLRATRALLAEDPDITAIVAYNDSCAVGVLDVLKQEGLDVPRDVSVIGYDNSSASRTGYLGLTTVSQDVSRLVALSLRRLVLAIEDPDLPREEFVLSPHLVDRSTTARPRTATPSGRRR